MQTIVDSVRQDCIDTEDERYRFMNPSGIEALALSIKNTGLINYPLLEKTIRGYRVVCGFKRILACRTLGFQKIDCRVIEDTPLEVDCLKIAIADNAMAKTLNILEEALAVVKLWRLCTTGDDLPQMAEPLGISINMALAEKYKRLCELPERIRELVGDDVISLKIALELGRINHPSAIEIANLFDALRPTFGQQKEMFSSIMSISKVFDTDIGKLLQTPSISGILEAEGLDRKQKIQMMRNEIRKMRYPHISHYEASFYDNLERLRLGEGLSLIPPRDFESPVYSFVLDFRNIEELQKKTDQLKQLGSSNALKTIMKREIEDT